MTLCASCVLPGLPVQGGGGTLFGSRMHGFMRVRDVVFNRFKVYDWVLAMGIKGWIQSQHCVKVSGS